MLVSKDDASGEIAEPRREPIRHVDAHSYDPARNSTPGLPLIAYTAHLRVREVATNPSPPSGSAISS